MTVLARRFLARPSARTAAAVAAMLGDGANLILIDEEIRLAFTSQADHAVVEILDPAGDGFAVLQFHLNRDLAVAQRAEVERFLSSFARGWSFVPASGGLVGRHESIVAARRITVLSCRGEPR